MDQGQTQDGTAQLDTTFERLESLTSAKQEVLRRYQRGEISAGQIQAFANITDQVWTECTTALGITERQLVGAGSP